MRKIAYFAEVPTALLDELKNLVDGQFCIATECLKDLAYRDWHFKNRLSQRIYLDNGVHEEESPLDSDILFDLALDLQPEVVFAPDVLGDMETTLSLTSNFRDKAERHGGIRDCRIGVVPHGKTAEEVVACLLALREMKRPNEQLFIGLPFKDFREEVCGILTQRKLWRRFDEEYHCLGFHGVSEVATWPAAISSMDTVKPVKAAIYDFSLDECPRGLGSWSSSWIVAHPELLFKNIARMHRVLSVEE